MQQLPKACVVPAYSNVTNETSATASIVSFHATQSWQKRRWWHLSSKPPQTDIQALSVFGLLQRNFEAEKKRTHSLNHDQSDITVTEVCLPNVGGSIACSLKIKTARWCCSFIGLLKSVLFYLSPCNIVTCFQRIVTNVVIQLQKSSRNYQFRAQQRH